MNFGNLVITTNNNYSNRQIYRKKQIKHTQTFKLIAEEKKYIKHARTFNPRRKLKSLAPTLQFVEEQFFLSSTNHDP